LQIEQSHENIAKLDTIKNYQQESLQLHKSNLYFIIYNNETEYHQKYSSSNQNIAYSLDAINFLAGVFGKENVLLSLKKPVQSTENKRT